MTNKINIQTIMKGNLLILLFVMINATTMAQGKYGATPTDSTECLKNTSLYGEFYRQKAYRDAIAPWLKTIELCPKSSKNLYKRGAKMYKSFIKKEEDEAKKAALVDSLMWIYDLRIENYGKRGYVLGRKGADLLRYAKKTRYEEAYNILKESFELQGNKSEAGTIAIYYKAAKYMVKKKKLEPATMVELFPALSDAVTFNLNKAIESGKQKNIDRWKKTAANIETIFTPYANCESLVSIYGPKYEANKEDTALLKQIIAIFEKRDCTNEDLFLKASQSLHEIKPSGLSGLGIGVSLLKKKRFADAMPYFKEASEIAAANDVKIKALKYAGQSALALKQYASAKNYAMKMLQIDSKNGDAYMLIGDAYLYGSSTVGDNKCNQKGGIWAAMPKFQRAKSLDPALAEKANKKIGQCKAQFPTKEDCFFYGTTPDTEITVGGWINEKVKAQMK